MKNPVFCDPRDQPCTVSPYLGILNITGYDGIENIEFIFFLLEFFCPCLSVHSRHTLYFGNDPSKISCYKFLSH